MKNTQVNQLFLRRNVEITTNESANKALPLNLPWVSQSLPDGPSSSPRACRRRPSWRPEPPSAAARSPAAGTRLASPARSPACAAHRSGRPPSPCAPRPRIFPGVTQRCLLIWSTLSLVSLRKYFDWTAFVWANISLSQYVHKNPFLESHACFPIPTMRAFLTP